MEQLVVPHKKQKEGYRINGHWKYASGALHATIFTANCSLQDEHGNDLFDEEGNSIIKSFILKRDEVEILSGWSYFGLVATGSHAFDVHDVEVPANRSFKINTEIKVADEGFNYPFLQLAETTLTVNNLGMARRFVDLMGRVSSTAQVLNVIVQNRSLILSRNLPRVNIPYLPFVVIFMKRLIFLGIS